MKEGVALKLNPYRLKELRREGPQSKFNVLLLEKDKRIPGKLKVAPSSTQIN